MNESGNNDREFDELFGDFASPLADDGFSRAVMRRVARARWMRRLVIAAAGITGGVIAIAPFADVTNRLAGAVVTLARSWNDAAWLAQNQEIVVGILLIAAIPAAIRLLED